LSTTVVQVYISGPNERGPNERDWHKKHVGVACFVKDNPKKSYYIRIVDVAVSLNFHSLL